MLADAPQRLPRLPARRPAPTRRSWWRRHRGLLVLLAVAGALRLLVVLAYDPALWFPDSIDYVRAARTGEPLIHRPYGYSAFLALLDGLVPLRGVAVVQHLLGLVSVVLVYALLQHRGVSRRASLLAAAPLALDAYLLDVEHFVLAEALFVVLLAGAVVALLWKDRPGAVVTGAAGVLFGAFALTRTVGSFVALVVLGYLLLRVLLRSLRWTALAGFVVALAATVLPYLVWFSGTHGAYAVTDYTGHFLYGRTSNFVQCEKLDVPERLRGLCPGLPPQERPIGDYYVWDPFSPANYAPPGERPPYTDDDLREFSMLAIRGQPLDFAEMTLRSTVHYLVPWRFSGPRDTCPTWWVFPARSDEDECKAALAPVGLDGEPIDGRTRPAAVAVLRAYQHVVVTPGPVLALGMLAGGLALVRRGVPAGSRERLDPALLAALGVVLLAVPSATAAFDYRYLLPTLVVLPAAAALALPRRPAPPIPSRKQVDVPA